MGGERKSYDENEVDRLEGWRKGEMAANEGNTAAGREI